MIRMFAALALAVGLVMPAAAQGASDAAAAEGKFIEAIDALDSAAAALWDLAPLTFRKVLWVAEPPSGFGAYNPRETDVFDSGVEMIAYAEPVGFGWAKVGDVWRTNLVSDLSVKSKDGELLVAQEDFQTLEIASRVRNREFMATFTYTFTGIPSGEYILETTLRDVVTGKSGTLVLPFTVR